MAKPGTEGYEGLANLANAIRRSTALYVGMSLTPAGSTEEEMFACADRMAAWIGGRAQQAEEQQAETKPEQTGSLGVSWRDREQDL